MRFLTFGGTRGPLSILAVLAFLSLAAVSYGVLSGYLAKRAAENTPQQAAFFATSIDDALSRLRHLPFVIATEGATLDALQSGDVDALNLRLQQIAERSGAEFVYVLDINGRTIASSNFADEDSLVGNFYTFRPYFLDALNGEEGLFYAVGVTTGRPGYFVAQPVRDAASTVHGVVATKIGFAELSRSLANSGALVMVADRQGVIITSSDPSLIYGHLSPLSAFERRSLEEQQQFGDEQLFPVEWEVLAPNRAALYGTPYIWSQADLRNEDWTLHLLSDLGDLRRQAMLYVAIAALGLLALLITAVIYRATQLRRALAISDADRIRLAAEIDERERAERRLEEARVALAHKTKLETLGRLSASITHELGQPISALRNYIVAEEIATGAKPGTGWPDLSRLVDRMQRLLDQLRHFGRQSPATGTSPIVVDSALKAALALVTHSATAAGVRLVAEDIATGVAIPGDPDRFEQVLVNLLRNAIDAAAETQDGQVVVALRDDADAVKLTVADTGRGIGAFDINQLREPFFTTKPSGQGMGLGLAISGQIIDEMGGRLLAANAPAGGAVFTLTVPKKGSADG